MASDAVDAVIDRVNDGEQAVATRTGGPPPLDLEPPDDFGDGEPYGDGGGPSGSPLGNARLAMIMFLGAETMFFAGLVGTFLVFRVAHEIWPPPTMPRLPIVVTGINTLFLLYSALTMGQAHRAIRRGEQPLGVRLLLLTVLLGVAFLVIQGYEWIQLIGFGLTLSSGVYGATFYTLIGCHGLHVFGAVIWLVSVLGRAMRGRYSPQQHVGVTVCSMYWHYVVALWPVLYVLVYIY